MRRRRRPLETCLHLKPEPESFDLFIHSIRQIGRYHYCSAVFDAKKLSGHIVHQNTPYVSSGRNALAELRLHGHAKTPTEQHQRDHDLRNREDVIDLLILVGT